MKKFVDAHIEKDTTFTQRRIIWMSAHIPLFVTVSALSLSKNIVLTLAAPTLAILLTYLYWDKVLRKAYTNSNSIKLNRFVNITILGSSPSLAMLYFLFQAGYIPDAIVIAFVILVLVVSAFVILIIDRAK